jgi:flagellar hook assembly protein FlgD
VTLTLADATGRRCAVLVHRVQEAGTYRVVWPGRTPEGRRVPAGCYTLRLTAQGLTRTQPLLWMP